MQLTSNLNLKKPENTDNVNIDDLNGNADILDAAVAGKVDKVAGKGLSTEDFTAAEKSKLGASTASATSNTIAQRDASGNLTGRQIVATAPQGVAPFSVSSTAVVPSLNADLLDGLHASSFAKMDSVNSGLFYEVQTTDGIFLNGGAGPVEINTLRVTNTSLVPNLNADRLDGFHAVDMVTPYATTAGTSTAYTASFTPAFTKTAGRTVRIRTHLASGANPTLNANGTGASPIRKPNGSAANLSSGGIYTLTWDTTTTSFILQGEGGEYGTAVAADVLAGKTIGTEAGIVTGTMVDRAGDTAALSSAVSGTTLRLRASAGYRDGTNDFVTITDADFIADNIRDGVNLFGMVGSLVEGKRSATRTGIAIDGSKNVNDYVITGLDFVPTIAILYFSATDTWGINNSNNGQKGLVVTSLTTTSYYIYNISAQVRLTILDTNGNSCMVRLTSDNSRIGSGGTGTLLLIE